jgi:hypothetical protein
MLTWFLYLISIALFRNRGTRYRRHHATSQKVAGSIPDEVTALFSWPNTSSRTMVLISTQPLTEISTRNLPRVKGRPSRKADNLTAICEPIVWKAYQPRSLTTLWASTACHRDSFTYLNMLRDRSEEASLQNRAVDTGGCARQTDVKKVNLIVSCSRHIIRSTLHVVTWEFKLYVLLHAYVKRNEWYCMCTGSFGS